MKPRLRRILHAATSEAAAAKILQLMRERRSIAETRLLQSEAGAKANACLKDPPIEAGMPHQYLSVSEREQSKDQNSTNVFLIFKESFNWIAADVSAPLCRNKLTRAQF